MRKRKSVAGIVPQSELAGILRRERDRADRNGDVFSVIAMGLTRQHVSPRAGHRWQQRLGQLLNERLRSTDAAGWLGELRLGVVLPHTEEPGAWTLARDLERQLDDELECPTPRLSVYSYSGRSGGGLGGGLSDQSEPMEAFESLRGPRPAERDLDRVAGNVLSTPLEALLAEPPGLAKRALDIVVSVCGLLFFLPVIAAAALAIKLSSRGPIFFRQKRAGFGGRPFTFYKLRTMVDGAEHMKAALEPCNEADGPVFKIANDPRMSRVGRFFRMTSIDELPQLWNVLRGDMSIVGPRPPTLDEIPHYESWQRRRLLTMGGLTCLWQVMGRSNLGFTEWMRLDMRYLRRRSLWMDLVLIVRTIPAVLTCRGAR